LVVIPLLVQFQEKVEEGPVKNWKAQWEKPVEILQGFRDWGSM